MVKTSTGLVVLGAVIAATALFNHHRVLQANPLPDLFVNKLFVEYLMQGSRITIKSPAEQNYRLNVLRKNLLFIEDLNRGTPGGYSPNPLAVMTYDEVKAQMMGFNLPPQGINVEEISQERLAEFAQNAPVKSAQLGKKAWEVRIRYQQYCGGCWSFATVLALEKLMYDKVGIQYKFSEQHLIDCDQENNGCNGGLPHTAYKFVKEEGIALDSAYPFQGSETNCKKNLRNFKFGNSLSTQQIQYNHDIVLELVRRGIFIPIGINADESFQYASSADNVFNPSSCGARPNHAVTIVNATSEYFEIQNSWDTRWGNNGRKKIRPCNFKKEMMGKPSILFPPVRI